MGSACFAERCDAEPKAGAACFAGHCDAEGEDADKLKEIANSSGSLQVCAEAGESCCCLQAAST